MNQNTKSPRNKKIGIGIIVVLVLALVYFYFSGGTSSSGSLLTSSGFDTVGANELSILNQMRSLKIDTSLFSNPAYRSLVDYSVEITPENVGRPNPFAPISGVSDPNANTATNPVPQPTPSPIKK